MSRTAARLVLALTIILAATSWIDGPRALAQTPPAGSTAADAIMAEQKAAFLALPEPMRKGAQDALVWLGFYNGVVDGAFGARTRDAILAFQASLKAPADGALSPAELRALLAAAQKARDAVGFQEVTDARIGAKIHVPAKLLGRAPGRSLTSPRAPTPISAPSTHGYPPGRRPAKSLTRR